MQGTEAGALQVGDDATGNTHDVRRRSTEVVVPRSRSSPYFVVLQQVWINKYSQLGCMTKGGHATVGFGNPSAMSRPQSPISWTP
jgi:hypothetical protein